MSAAVWVGQQWADRDKRMTGRIVVVTEVSAGYVHYCARHASSFRYRSRLARFVKAFSLVAPAPERSEGPRGGTEGGER
jgi:hypothetical protein